MSNEEMSAQDTEYGLIVSFPDQSASFVHGFEAGSLWQKMESGTVAEIAVETHIENREVIARMADHLGWSYESEPTHVSGWDRTTLAKTRSERKRANTHGLRIVST